jgi:Tfp pilus assembly protein PilP
VDGARIVLRQQLAILLLLSITACSPAEVGAEKFDNYLQRLSRVADVEVESVEATRRPKIPTFSQSRTEQYSKRHAFTDRFFIA